MRPSLWPCQWTLPIAAYWSSRFGSVATARAPPLNGSTVQWFFAVFSIKFALLAEKASGRPAHRTAGQPALVVMMVLRILGPLHRPACPMPVASALRPARRQARLAGWLLWRARAVEGFRMRRTATPEIFFSNQNFPELATYHILRNHQKRRAPRTRAHASEERERTQARTRMMDEDGRGWAPMMETKMDASERERTRDNNQSARRRWPCDWPQCIATGRRFLAASFSWSSGRP